MLACYWISPLASKSKTIISVSQERRQDIPTGRKKFQASRRWSFTLERSSSG